MKWFKVYIGPDEVPIETRKKLFRDFFKLLIEEEFSTGLAMHFSIEKINQDNIRYFSTPDEHYHKLISIFEGFSYQEISQPNLDLLKTVIGEL